MLAQDAGQEPRADPALEEARALPKSRYTTELLATGVDTHVTEGTSLLENHLPEIRALERVLQDQIDGLQLAVSMEPEEQLKQHLINTLATLGGAISDLREAAQRQSSVVTLLVSADQHFEKARKRGQDLGYGEG